MLFYLICNKDKGLYFLFNKFRSLSKEKNIVFVECKYIYQSRIRNMNFLLKQTKIPIVEGVNDFKKTVKRIIWHFLSKLSFLQNLFGSYGLFLNRKILQLIKF